MGPPTPPAGDRAVERRQGGDLDAVLLSPDDVDDPPDGGIDHGKERALRPLVRIGEELGAELLAGGISNSRDRTKLIELGVGYGQEFLWGKPRVLEIVTER